MVPLTQQNQKKLKSAGSNESSVDAAIDKELACAGVEIRKKCITGYLCLILRCRRIFAGGGVSRLAKTTLAVIMIDIKCSC